MIKETIKQGPGFQFLVMGRPEGPGCYCGVNELMKHGIDGVSKRFDVTLIDCEAGPEQVNRRVVKGVDLLIIVTDCSFRGAQVARSIMEVIQKDEEIRPGRIGLVINRFKGEDKLIRETMDKLDLQILGHIPEDENISQYDLTGRPIIDLPDTSPSVVAVAKLLQKIDLVILPSKNLSEQYLNWRVSKMRQIEKMETEVVIAGAGPTACGSGKRISQKGKECSRSGTRRLFQVIHRARYWPWLVANIP